MVAPRSSSRELDSNQHLSIACMASSSERSGSEPTSGIEPEPSVYETGARPSSCAGRRLAVHRHEDRRRREPVGRDFVRVRKPWLFSSFLKRVLFPLGYRLLAEQDWIRTSVDLRVGHPRRTKAPAEGIEPSKYRLTAGCLTIRLRWNICSPRACGLLPTHRARSLSRRNGGAVSQRARGETWRQLFTERAPPEGGTDPGTGFEPVFLDSETSVLPARRSRNEPRRPASRGRSGRSGGNRTLSRPGKSRVRFQLRYGPVRVRVVRPRACRERPPPRRTAGASPPCEELHGRRRHAKTCVNEWDARGSNPHPSG